MKKIAHFPIAILLLAFLSTSCEKELQTSVYGYAKTYGSSTTHQGIKVELYGGAPGGVLGGGSHRLIASTTTDENGYYRIDARLSDSEPHYLFCPNQPSKHYSFAHANTLDFLKINAGQNKQVDVVFDPFAWLNIHFKNVDPYDYDDRISFTNNGYQSLVGGGVDKWVVVERMGNRNINFHYSVHKNDQHTSHVDTVGYVAAFDTVDFEVFY